MDQTSPTQSVQPQPMNNLPPKKSKLRLIIIILLTLMVGVIVGFYSGRLIKPSSKMTDLVSQGQISYQIIGKVTNITSVTQPESGKTNPVSGKRITVMGPDSTSLTFFMSSGSDKVKIGPYPSLKSFSDWAPYSLDQIGVGDKIYASIFALLPREGHSTTDLQDFSLEGLLLLKIVSGQ